MKLAQEGVPVGRHYRRAAVAVEGCLRDDPAAKRTFLAVSKGTSAAPEPGWRLVQKDLAATLRRLGRNPEAFYRGPLADRIAAAVRARGGILTAWWPPNSGMRPKRFLLRRRPSYCMPINREELEPRPPVVTIMGHVDHGKSSLD